MKRIRTLFVSTVILAAAAVGLAACDGGPSTSSTVTRSRLERSLERTYVNRYIAFSKLVGHPGVSAASMGAHAVCDKGGPTVADVGPGGDWICQIAYTDANVPNPDGSAKVEMNVHSNDCYTAGASSKLVGPLNITDAHGRQVINPVFEFDGCFDPNANAHPNGTIIIANQASVPGGGAKAAAAAAARSQLTLPTGLVSAASDGRVPLQLACGDGSSACTGTLTVQLQGATLRDLRFDVPAGSSRTMHLQLSHAQQRDGGLLTLTEQA